jgi:predicted HicB family RNase H-like nuclease
VSTIYLRNVPEDLHRQVKSEAALRGMTLQDFVIKVLQEYLKKGKKKGRG